MALSPQWLDELRSRVTLSSVIMRTDKLQKAGNEWKACCPFHNEKSPSFTVNDQKGFYHCFGCQAHGDVISWLTDQRGMEFMDAVKQLAAEAGMEVPANDPKSAARARQQAGLHDVMQSAQDHFAQSLTSGIGAAARDYLASRGIDPATREHFGFGYAPPDRQALKSALSQYQHPLMVEAGLRIDAEGKGPYDRFRARLMLPIHDARGRVIGFGGRILDGGAAQSRNVPKYLNSPDTPLFDKGRNLYNLHRAAPASRQTERLIVVEGYMDVVALAIAGFADVVAPMGTALTEHQLRALWRLVAKPVLCFDGDAAGRRAAMRAATRALPLLEPSYSLRIAHLPPGLDPDDLVKQRGPPAFADILQNASSLLDLIWRHERDAQPLNDPEDKAGLKARLLAHAETIQHGDIRALYRRELLARFSAFAFPPGKTWKRANGSHKSWQHSAHHQHDPRVEAHDAETRRRTLRQTSIDAGIYGLALHPECLADNADRLIRFAETNPDYARIIDRLLDAIDVADAMDGLRAKLAARFTCPTTHRFLFLEPDTGKSEAVAALNRHIAILCDVPLLDQMIKAADARFDHDPEGAWAERQELVARKQQILA